MHTAAAGEGQIARGNQGQCRLAAVTDRNSSGSIAKQGQQQGDASSTLHGGKQSMSLTRHPADGVSPTVLTPFKMETVVKNVKMPSYLCTI